MKSLKTKASRFFRDVPSQDEKGANADIGCEADFSAGILGSKPRKKPSRFLLRKHEKVDNALPTPPLDTCPPVPIFLSPAPPSPAVTVFEEDEDHFDDSTSHHPFALPQTTPLTLPLLPHDCSETPVPSPTSDSTNESKPKPRPSFASLKKKSSRLFRNNGNSISHLPPPPPLPQIPVDPPASRRSRPVLTPLILARDNRSFTANPHGRNISISRPTLVTQYGSPKVPNLATTVAFAKPAGSAPSRPPRPDSLDDEIVTFMRENGTRMCLPTNNRASASTATCSTPRSYESSIEVSIAFPSEYGVPRSYSIESPLAVHFPFDPSQPLPIRDSTGSIKSYSRFSEYIKGQQDGYAVDGVYAEDRDTGPIEQYSASKEDEWVLMKRVSKGPNGNSGMMFRDKWGGFHFVTDV